MAVPEKLDCFSVPAVAKHTATVVFIHGLGDTGHGWEPVANVFKNDPDLDHIKWVFPHSPRRSVTANPDIKMPSWFDIYSFGFNVREDEEGMEESVSLIKNVILDEINSGIKSNRIILGGFSQGGAMSLLTSLTSDFDLAGIVCLSGWLPLRDKFNNMANREAFSTPIFWCHGSADPLVKPEYSKEGVDQLIKLGVPLAMSGVSSGLSYNIYEGMGHTTNQKELDDLRVFIKSVVPCE